MVTLLRNNRQYLEQHRGKWRVTVSVPKHLHQRLGTRLKRSLNTDSLTIANQLKWPIVREFQALIADADAGTTKDYDAVAAELRRQQQVARSDDELAQIEDHITIVAESLVGPEVGVAMDEATGRDRPIYDPSRLAVASRFVQLARGLGTPIDHLHQRYVEQLTVKPRTQGDDLRAIALLKRWCVEQGIEPFLQSFANKRDAVRFMDALPELEPSLSPVTLNKYLRRLSRYWQWLENREEVPANVWHGLTLPEPETPHDQKERPFTDEEVVKLLGGEATQAMHDLMRIAALTGARIDPIVCLRVRDCRPDGVFVFKPQKKEKAERLCPIHPALGEIIARRTNDKAPDDPVFPEWPAPKNSNSKRERSYRASNQFTAYRREVGVAEELEGRRRSLVNFHSFRRWFITKAERAGQPEHIIAAVVGHKRQGMTLGVYSAGPAIEQARRCVEAVQLPALHATIRL